MKNMWKWNTRKTSKAPAPRLSSHRRPEWVSPSIKRLVGPAVAFLRPVCSNAPTSQLCSLSVSLVEGCPCHCTMTLEVWPHYDSPSRGWSQCSGMKQVGDGICDSNATLTPNLEKSWCVWYGLLLPKAHHVLHNPQQPLVKKVSF